MSADPTDDLIQSLCTARERGLTADECHALVADTFNARMERSDREPVRRRQAAHGALGARTYTATHDEGAISEGPVMTATDKEARRI